MWWIFVAVLLANYFIMRVFALNPEPTVPVPYTVFKEQVAQGNVKSIYSKGQNIEGQFLTPVVVPR